MKKFLFLIALTGLLAALTAAETTQVAIFNYGKTAVLKDAKGSVSPGFAQQKDRKTGAVVYKCLYFTLTEKGNAAKKFDLSFEAGNGNLVVFIGHRKADPFLWTSLMIDGKEQIKNKKGELFQLKKFTVGNLTKPKTIKITASYRVPSKKELNAEKKAQRTSKKRSKKSQKK